MLAGFKNHLFTTIIVFLTGSSVFAQYSLSGTVTDSENQSPVENAEVYLTEIGKSTVTDANGQFQFYDLSAGTYDLIIFSFEYETFKKTISLSENTSLNLGLDALSETLSEVVIKKRREQLFALRRLKDVEGTSIFAGKKSEVVAVNKLTANKAANKARQIYAQVVGLNIYDNSDAGLQLNIGGRGLDPALRG